MTDILDLLQEKKLISCRWGWSAKNDSGETLFSLYTALTGDVDSRPKTCPENVAPRWVAHLIPRIDGCSSLGAWEGFVRRVAAMAPRLQRFSEFAASSACDWRVRALCVREAARYASRPETRSICNSVADLCYMRGTGDSVSDDDFNRVIGERLSKPVVVAIAGPDEAARSCAHDAARPAGHTHFHRSAASAASMCEFAIGSSKLGDRRKLFDVLARKILNEIERSLDETWEVKA